MIWYLIVPLIVAGGFIFSFSRRKSRSAPALEIVIGLLDDISYDLDLAEKMRDGIQAKKILRFSNWRINRNKLGFLEPELESRINETFSFIADKSTKTEAAKGKKDSASWTNEELDTLKLSLTELGAVLIDWLKETPENKNELWNGRNR